MHPLELTVLWSNSIRTVLFPNAALEQCHASLAAGAHLARLKEIGTP